MNRRCARTRPLLAHGAAHRTAADDHRRRDRRLVPHPARCDRPCRSTGRWQVKHIPFSPTPERGFFRHPAPANTAPYPSSGPRRPLYLPDHTPAILPARKPGKRPGRRGKPTRGDRKIVRPSRTAGSGIRPPLTEPGNIAFHFFLTTFDLTNGQKAFVILLPLKTATFHVPGAMNATC